MAIPIIRYELDTTGENLNNKVVGEIRTLSENELRAVAPSYGAYFTESLIIKDNVTQLPLTREIDYYCVELLQEASVAYGKEICYLILIVNQNVTEVKFDYQVLGGLYTRSADKLVDLYEKLIIDDRPVDWVKILNKPYEYNPTKHLHDLKDVYGFQYLVDSLERIRSAILIGSAQANQDLVDWVNSRIDNLQHVSGTLQHVSGTLKGIVNNIPLQELGGVDKLINGVRIGRGGGNLTNNVVLGPNTLTANSTGSDIVAIGINSMSGNTVGNDNIGIGSGAGSIITIGSNNIVIGCQAQPSAPTVSNEITLGNQSSNLLRLPGIGFQFSSNSIKFTDGSVQSSAARGIFD